VICWPLLSLRRIAGRDHRPGAGLLAKGGRMARSYVLTRNATSAGVREAVDGDGGGRVEDGRARWSRSDHLADATRPEGRARAHTSIADRQVGSAPRPALTAVPQGATAAVGWSGSRGDSGSDVGVRPLTAVAPAASSASQPDDHGAHGRHDSRAPGGSGSAAIGSVRPQDVEVREAARRRAVDRGLYVPDQDQPGDVPRRVLTGRVMAPDEDPFSRRPLHDSNRRNGDLPRVVYVYDPAQARDVPISEVTSAAHPVPAGGVADGAVR
jgi:hypothetical protein